MTANLQTGLTVKQAARLMNVSERNVYNARKLRRSGRDDLVARVECGELSINAALKLAYPPASGTQAGRPGAAYESMVCGVAGRPGSLLARRGHDRGASNPWTGRTSFTGTNPKLPHPQFRT